MNNRIALCLLLAVLLFAPVSAEALSIRCPQGQTVKCKRVKPSLKCLKKAKRKAKKKCRKSIYSCRSRVKAGLQACKKKRKNYLSFCLARTSAAMKRCEAALQAKKVKDCRKVKAAYARCKTKAPSCKKYVAYGKKTCGAVKKACMKKNVGIYSSLCRSLAAAKACRCVKAKRKNSSR